MPIVFSFDASIFQDSKIAIPKKAIALAENQTLIQQRQKSDISPHIVLTLLHQ